MIVALLEACVVEVLGWTLVWCNNDIATQFYVSVFVKCYYISFMSRSLMGVGNIRYDLTNMTHTLNVYSFVKLVNEWDKGM